MDPYRLPRHIVPTRYDRRPSTEIRLGVPLLPAVAHETPSNCFVPRSLLRCERGPPETIRVRKVQTVPALMRGAFTDKGVRYTCRDTV
jgi:hypothetical protein